MDLFFYFLLLFIFLKNFSNIQVIFKIVDVDLFIFYYCLFKKLILVDEVDVEVRPMLCFVRSGRFRLFVCHVSQRGGGLLSQEDSSWLSQAGTQGRPSRHCKSEIKNTLSQSSSYLTEQLLIPASAP